MWLRGGNEKKKILETFISDSEKIGFRLNRKDLIQFPDRTVALVFGSFEQMCQSIDLMNCIAEVRKAKEAANFFTRLPSREQKEWADDARERVHPSSEDACAVCLLDTGINRLHMLIENHLASEDTHCYEPSWGRSDHCGHGTEMAGIALYGDLTDFLAGNDRIELKHRLESVKILPPRGENDPRLYGYITAESVARAEIEAPRRKRAIAMTVTTTDFRDRGHPSSWSAAIDQICFSDNADHKRLMFISAGNADLAPPYFYPDSNFSDGVHDPGQAWNALTVGAFTEKFTIDPEEFPDWRPVAPKGGLCPSSTTSLLWKKTDWPIKPEIVFEGGNYGLDPSTGEPDCLDSLSMLTTFFKPAQKLFTVTGDTSAAATLASRMAAILIGEYPDLWPETIRALIAHSADWTKEMKARFPKYQKTRGEMENLLRYCGFGTPNITRALRSASNDLSLIVQDSLHPYEKEDDKAYCTTRDMNLHRIPWPTDTLMELGETEVEMKVTLSYFIEPNPGRRGYKRKYSYASHGLRFDVKTATETIDEFRKRKNKDARQEGEKGFASGDSSEWLLGPDLRTKGSLHSDRWTGTAADLAQKGIIAVYPVTGWWKERPKLEKWRKNARYSLIVTISTPKTNVDVYTPIVNQISIET